MFRSEELRKYSFFAYTKWNGGFYGTYGPAGSRPGSSSAGAWIAMMYHGEKLYFKFMQIYFYILRLLTYKIFSSSITHYELF